MKIITKEQVVFAIKHKEFPQEVIGKMDVAIILTQSWCPQWQMMKRWVDGITQIQVFLLEYDNTDFFESFKSFKEETFRNDQIPYVRYYSNGKLVGESNYVGKDGFLARFSHKT